MPVLLSKLEGHVHYQSLTTPGMWVIYIIKISHFNDINSHFVYVLPRLGTRKENLAYLVVDKIKFYLLVLINV